jgi:hypothetical protein
MMQGEIVKVACGATIPPQRAQRAGRDRWLPPQESVLMMGLEVYTRGVE